MKEIEDLISRRSVIIDINEEKECEDDTVVDQLAKEILTKIYDNRDNLAVDFILESLTHLGWAPCLIYDDNGHWAISEDGVSSVSMKENDDTYISHHSEQSDFRDTIREAVNHYLNKSKEEGDML